MKIHSYGIQILELCREQKFVDVWVTVGKDEKHLGDGFPLQLTSAWTNAHRYWLQELLLVRCGEHLLDAIENELREIYYKHFPYV